MTFTDPKVTPAERPFEYGPGILGEAALFSWANGYPGICFPKYDNLDGSKGTLSVWLKWDPADFPQPILSQHLGVHGK